MKLTVLREDLNGALGIVNKVVEPNISPPIIRNILLSTDRDKLKLSATNLEETITCWIDAIIEENGAICVPAKLLSEFVESLPNDRVDIALDGIKLKIKCAGARARISGIISEDYPSLPSLDDGLDVEVEASQLTQAISQVVFASATDSSRPVLTGTKVTFKDKMITFGAADGMRLAEYTIAITHSIENEVSTLIPSKILSDIGRLISRQQKPVKMVVGRSLVVFSMENIKVSSQVLQGDFPNLEALTNFESTTIVTVKTSEITKAVKIASTFAKLSHGVIRLVFESGKIKVISSPDESGESEIIVDCNIRGEENRIAFNGKLLLEGLSVIQNDEEVEFNIVDSSKPCLIRPSGVSNYVQVIMPMAVSW